MYTSFFSHSCWYKCRSGIAGSYGNPMFNFLSNFQSVFHQGCPILYSQKQYMKVLFFFHILITLVICSLIRTILLVWPACLIAICISFSEFHVQIFCPLFGIVPFIYFVSFLSFSYSNVTVMF